MNFLISDSRISEQEICLGIFRFAAVRVSSVGTPTRVSSVRTQATLTLTGTQFGVPTLGTRFGVLTLCECTPDGAICLSSTVIKK